MISLLLATLLLVPPSRAAPSAELLKVPKAALDRHNLYRGDHGVAPLTWNPSAAAFAQQYCNKLASTGTVGVHSHDPRYGENLFWETRALDADVAVDKAIRLWYEDEIKLYDFNNPGFYQNPNTGHVTLLLWKTVTAVGCAVNLVKRQFSTYVCCNYTPRGNVRGQFRENVLPAPKPYRIEPPKKTICPYMSGAKSMEPVKAVLKAHLDYRAKHGLEQLSWSGAAGWWAEKICKELAQPGAVFKSAHAAGRAADYGENLYRMGGVHSTVQDRVAAIKQAIGAWYAEGRRYDYSNPGPSSGTDHFTQVVWKATKKVACEVSTSNTHTFVCCFYTPPGNTPGGYKDNVPRPL